MALQAGTEFLYGDEGLDFGEDLGGCGESSAILEEAARFLGISGVKFEWGHAVVENLPGEIVGHAWLVVDDSAVYDPAAWANQYTVTEYDPYTPRRKDKFQSDLKQCLIGIEPSEIRLWARKVAKHMRPFIRTGR